MKQVVVLSTGTPCDPIHCIPPWISHYQECSLESAKVIRKHEIVDIGWRGVGISKLNVKTYIAMFKRKSVTPWKCPGTVRARKKFSHASPGRTELRLKRKIVDKCRQNNQVYFLPIVTIRLSSKGSFFTWDIKKWIGQNSVRCIVLYGLIRGFCH